MGRAFSEIVTAELSSDPAISVITSTRLHSFQNIFGVRPVASPGISAERPLALAAGANRIAYGDYATVRGRLTARVFLEDPAARQITEVLSASVPAGDVVGAATAIARQISRHAVDYGTHNIEALRGFAAALESSDPAKAVPELEQAIAADPAFGPPYALLARFRTQQGDRAGAVALLDSALSRGNAMPAPERARLQVEKANLMNDPAARDRALAELVRISPRDPVSWRSLAENSYVRHEYKTAVGAYRKLVELDPQDAASWNQLAYSAAKERDLDTAVQALRRYQELRPNDPNPLDSLGDVHLMVGRLHEAEEYYLQAGRKNPSFLNSGPLFKAAMARLMSGDISGADGLAKQYLDARAAAGDPNAPVLAADWSWLAGRRNEARRKMEEVLSAAETAAPALAALASAQLSVWSSLAGDRESADRYAQHALQLRVTPVSAMARFLSFPPASPEEWKTRAARVFPDTQSTAFRDVALSYALLAAREFAPATQVLRRLYEDPAVANEPGIPVELAWSLVAAGQYAEAAPLLDLNPVPPAGPDLFMGFYFPRLYELRAAAAEKSGKTDEVRANRELFRKLSGGEPLP